MKLNCGLSRQEKDRIWSAGREKRLADAKKAENSWEDTFAWWPVRVGPNDCRWFETVQCQPEFSYYYGLKHYDRWDVRRLTKYKYRAKEKK